MVEVPKGLSAGCQVRELRLLQAKRLELYLKPQGLHLAAARRLAASKKLVVAPSESSFGDVDLLRRKTLEPLVQDFL